MQEKSSCRLVGEYTKICQAVHYFLLESTPKFVRQYTISCWGVHQNLSDSTLFLVEEYTIACWTVHYFLVGEYPMTNRHVFSTFAGVFVVGSMIAHSILAKQYTIASFRGKRPNKIPEVVMQLWAHPRYCVASASLVEQSAPCWAVHYWRHGASDLGGVLCGSLSNRLSTRA